MKGFFKNPMICACYRRIPETDTLDDILSRHLGPEADPLVKHRLKPYTQVDKEELGVFLKKDGTAGSETRWVL